MVNCWRLLLGLCSQILICDLCLTGDFLCQLCLVYSGDYVQTVVWIFHPQELPSQHYETRYLKNHGFLGSWWVKLTSFPISGGKHQYRTQFKLSQINKFSSTLAILKDFQLLFIPIFFCILTLAASHSFHVFWDFRASLTTLAATFGAAAPEAWQKLTWWPSKNPNHQSCCGFLWSEFKTSLNPNSL